MKPSPPSHTHTHTPAHTTKVLYNLHELTPTKLLAWLCAAVVLLYIPNSCFLIPAQSLYSQSVSVVRPDRSMF